MISCWIPSWIALGLGGRSFCRIRLWIFPVRLLHGSPCALEVGLFIGSNHVGFLSDCLVDCLLSFGLVRSWIFFVVFLQHTLLFFGLVLFFRVWRYFLQRPIELGRCGLDVLCGGPQHSPFCLINWIFSRIGSWGSVVESFSGSYIFLLSVLLLDWIVAVHVSDQLPDRIKNWMIW